MKLTAENLTYGLHYGGAWRRPWGTRTIEVSSPATGVRVAAVPIAEAPDVAAAVDAAAHGFIRWNGTDPLDRGRPLRALADLMRARLEELAGLESAVTGRPIREMRAQLSRTPEWLDYFAGIGAGLEGSANRVRGDFLTYSTYEPLGVCALLTPWNHPILILVKKLAAAVAAGNTCIIKPSELAPVTPLLLAEWCTEAGFPEGVVNVVTGDAETGALVCAAPAVQHINLTGSTATGRRVAAAAAARLVPCVLELGGKTPVIVFDDVPVPEAAAAAVFSAFVASGQTCVSASRFLVSEHLYGAFLEAFAARTRALRIGDPADPATDIGPVISAASRDRCLRHIADARADGASLLVGGVTADLPRSLANGHFVTPTVFAGVSPQMRLFREEVFGPVVAVTAFHDETEALALANDTQYALGASVWCRDVGRAHRMAGSIRAGMVWINDHHKNDPRSLWGGWGESGYGKENGWDSLKGYLRKRQVVIRTNPVFDDWFANGTRYG
jgi:acyl-CoA reductase-like NAD-dependent aldehyde dehydrogenase